MHRAGVRTWRASQDRTSLPERSIHPFENSQFAWWRSITSQADSGEVVNPRIIGDSYQIGLFQSLPAARSERRIATADSLINASRQWIYSPTPISSSKRNVQRPSNDIRRRIYSELLTI